jgi:hypothetical protein
VNFFVVKMRANVFEEKLEELEGVLRALGLEVVLQLLQVRSDLTQHHWKVYFFLLFPERLDVSVHTQENKVDLVSFALLVVVLQVLEEESHEGV